MKDIYRSFENFENERYLLRTVTMADAPALLQVYSDKHALPFFNSDNCHGDNFYYTTLERMRKTIDFWQYSYDNGWFVRWCIADKAAGQAIGTVELFTRSSDDEYDGDAVLRLDLRSDYEEADQIAAILLLLLPHIPALFAPSVITKAPCYAVERQAALRQLGFRPSEEYLIGEDGEAYNGYWKKSQV